MTKIAGSGSGSSQRHTSAEPDPYQNVTYPQHWLYSTNTCKTFTLVDLWKGKGIESDNTEIFLRNKTWIAKKSSVWMCLCLVVTSSAFSSDTWRSFSIFSCSRLLAISATYTQRGQDQFWWEKKCAKLFSRNKRAMQRQVVYESYQNDQQRCEFGSISKRYGSGSVSKRYGSGSFYHEAKIVRGLLIPRYFMWILYNFLSLKNDVISQKTWHLEGYWQKFRGANPYPYRNVPDP